MLLVLGVVMAMIGVALCLKGEVHLPGERLLRPIPARIAGGVLLSFLPLVVLTRVFVDNLDPRHITWINWGLALACLAAAGGIVLRTARSLKPARPRAPRLSSSGLVDVPGDVSPNSPPAPASGPLKRSSPQRNPFDFS